MKIRIFFIAFILFSNSLYANKLQALYKLYEKRSYMKACDFGLKIFQKYKKNPKFLMLYGLSCLNADHIDRLAVPMISLRYDSKAQRVNASYFATILLQKKLLIHALIDHVDLSNLSLPKTDYLLSKVFELYSQKAYTKHGYKYHLHPNEDKETTYVLYLLGDPKKGKLVIEERHHNRLIKTHRYW